MQTPSPSLSVLPWRGSLCLAVVLLMLAQVPAQTASRDRLNHAAEPLLVPIHTAAADTGSAYGIWAAGTAYKASFHGGLTFVPMLGADYPHNQPLAWRTLSARVGDEELLTREATLSWNEWRAEYDHGNVVEAYDVHADGLEQTFVIRQRPVGEGHLRIRGAVTTALRCPSIGPAHQALVFCDDAGEPITSYGAATAIDATGARRAMRTSYADGEVVLQLDGEWLAAATFPVVVDPLIGPATAIYGSPRLEVDSVTAHSLSGEVVWLAFSTAASASDSDLYVRRWTAAGALGSIAFADVTTSWSTRRPRCAFDDYSDRALITFDRSFPAGSRGVRLHIHGLGDTSTSTAYHPIPATDNAWRADVGTRTFSSGGQAFVVWQQEPNGGGAFAESASSDIFGCHVDPYTGAATTPFPIADGVGLDHERPRTNDRTSSGPAKVVYQFHSSFGSNDDWDVAVRTVDSTGTVSAAFLVDDGSPDHKLAPQIDGFAEDCMVVFTSSTLVQQPGKPTGSNGHQIRAVRLKWATGVPAEPFGTVVVQSNSDARLELEGLAVDRGAWSMWGLLFRSTSTENLYFRTLGFRGGTVHAETVLTPAGGETSVGGGVSNTYDGAFHIAYAKNGSTTFHYLTYDRFEFPAATPWTVTGSSCSPATISWFGRQQIGTNTSGVFVSGAPLGMLHLLLVGLAPTQFVFQGIPPVLDGCALLVPSAGPDHVALTLMGQHAFFPTAALIPLPELLSAGTLYFQDFHTDATFTQLLSTQRLEVPLVR